MMVGITANVVHYARNHQTGIFTPEAVAAAYGSAAVPAYAETMALLAWRGETLAHVAGREYRVKYTDADFARMAGEA